MAKRSREASISSLDEATPSTTQSQSTSIELVGHSAKYSQTESPILSSSSANMRCLLPPHKPLTFSSYPDYETHYTQTHSNRCSACAANFPTAHFLNLHISENHDPIIAAQRDRSGSKTFGCFVEGCEKVCADWKKRRSHLVDKHGFPRNYDFLVVDSGVDGKRSMLRAGVDGSGHRASSRERRGSEGSDGTVSTKGTSVSPEPPSSAVAKGSFKAQSTQEAKAPQESPSSPPWKGKKRSGSTRSLPYGAPVMPAKADMDSIISSMSALNMVPRSVARAKK